MAAQRKTQGRIATTKAKEEASALVELLATDLERAVTRGGELAQAYSLTPRISIVKELGARLLATPNPPPLAGILRLLSTFRMGLKSAQEPEFAAGILEFALSCRGPEATLAEELIYERIAESGFGAELSLRVEAIPVALATDVRFISSAARVLQLADRRGKATDKVLQHWADLIEPLTRPDREDKTAIQSASAAELLGALAATRVERVPDGLAITVVRLVAVSSPEQAAGFYSTALGQRILILLKIPSSLGAALQPTPSPPMIAGDLQAVRSKFHARLQSVLDELLEEVGRVARSGAKELESKCLELDKLKVILAQTEKERDAGKDKADQAVKEAEAVGSRLAVAAADAEASRAEAERWRVEAKRREDELGGQFRVEQQHETQRHSRLIMPPLREVYEHLIRLLMAERGNEPLRRLAVSFDSLQKGLGRVFGTAEIQRLPQELLVRAEEGAVADETGN